jgi:hypothetical protein
MVAETCRSLRRFVQEDALLAKREQWLARYTHQDFSSSHPSFPSQPTGKGAALLSIAAEGDSHLKPSRAPSRSRRRAETCIPGRCASVGLRWEPRPGTVISESSSSFQKWVTASDSISETRRELQLVCTEGRPPGGCTLLKDACTLRVMDVAPSVSRAGAAPSKPCSALSAVLFTDSNTWNAVGASG